MHNDKTLVVRCRGIILHQGKMLVVRHPGSSGFVALPGGHLEWGEDIKACMRREIIEELGVEPEIRRLLYINNFTEHGQQSVEFIFEIANGEDFVDCERRDRSHAYELEEILWLGPEDDRVVMPKKIGEDLKAGEIIHDDVRYIG